MAIEYDEAVKRWGARKLDATYNYDGRRRKIVFKPENVEVKIELDQGNPWDDTFWEPPTAFVLIKDISSGKFIQISHEDFNFAEVVREIVEAGS